MLRCCAQPFGFMLGRSTAVHAVCAWLLLAVHLHNAAGARHQLSSPRRPNDAMFMEQADGVLPSSLHALPYYGPPRGDACSGLWPLPRSCNCSGDLTPDKQPETGGNIEMDSDHFQFVADGPAAKGSARLQRAFERFHDHIFQPLRPHSQVRNAAASASAVRSAGAPLFSLSVELATDNETLGLGVDESYSLSIETTVGWGSIGRLYAQSIWGALHGLESFSQLTVRTVGQPGSVVINSSYVFIEDAPRFAWRGIMIDTSRHWQPVSSIRTMIDALSFNRMNVLHWHITDMQSFPLKTKAFPRLVEGCASLAPSPLPLILSYKSEKSLCGAGLTVARDRRCTTTRTMSPRLLPTPRTEASVSFSHSQNRRV